MEVISILEHSTIPIVEKRSKGQKSLTPFHTAALAKLEKKLPLKTFSWGHQSIKFSHYCGVISLGDITLEVLPKIYGKETEPGASRKALINMLLKTRKLKLLRGGSSSIGLQKNTLLDVFILYFCELVYSEIMQGMIRQYVQRSENLNVLKGRLLIEKQFQYNTTHRDRLYCQYDEFKADNLHNQIIKYVLNSMSKLTTGVSARKKVCELLMHFADIQDINADLSMIERLYLDRSSQRYKPIFDQCRLFIQGLHPDVVAGHHTCISLLFDMNRLFESYVARIMKKIALKQGKQMREQGPRKFMAFRDDNNEQIFMMKPDMVFIDPQTGPFAIMDAKWKLLDDREKKLGISQNDMYQISAYANRYNIKKLALVYPYQQYLTSPLKLSLQKTQSTLNIIPMDISATESFQIEIFIDPVF